jgi:hypothetical protein
VRAAGPARRPVLTHEEARPHRGPPAGAGVRSRPHARVLDLQRRAGNRAVTALVARQRLRQRRGPLDRIDKCYVGEPAVPHSLADAIRRRQIDPASTDAAQHLPHFDFVEWLGTQGLDREDQARFVNWSWEIHLEDLAEEHRRNIQGEDLFPADHPWKYPTTVPRDPSKLAKPRRRGQWLKAVVMGGVEYVVDLGRGVVHIGRYGKASIKAIWDPSELQELTNNDLAFIALVGRVFTEPVEVMTRIAAGYSAAIAAQKYLTKDQEDQLKEAAAGAIPNLVEKLIGKQLAKKLIIAVAVGPLIEKLAARVTNEIIKRGLAKAKGAPLLVLSILGMLDKAHTSARRLKRDDPLLYRYLESDGLHIAWFLVEEPLKEVRKQLEKSLADQLGKALR